VLFPLSPPPPPPPPPETAVAESADAAPADLADLVVDADGGYLPQLAAAGHVAALVRPDHYLFGGVAAAADLPGLVDDLRRQLTGAPRS
jgi:flavoprotein hydroxylase